jgi:hypothetical protein
MDKFTFNIPGTGAIEFDFAKVPEGKREYIRDGATRQGIAVLLQRCTAGIESPSTADKTREQTKLLAELQNGTYEFGSGGGARVDPITAILRTMAFAMAREANWKLEAAHEFSKECGPIATYCAAALLRAGKMSAAAPDADLIQQAVDTNSDAIIRQAKTILANQTVDISI